MHISLSRWKKAKPLEIIALSRPAEQSEAGWERVREAGVRALCPSCWHWQLSQRRGPHPGFAHLLPSCFAFGYAGRAKAITLNSPAISRPRKRGRGSRRKLLSAVTPALLPPSGSCPWVCNGAATSRSSTSEEKPRNETTDRPCMGIGPRVGLQVPETPSPFSFIRRSAAC